MLVLIFVAVAILPPSLGRNHVSERENFNYHYVANLFKYIYSVLGT
jgi:hypothetical protein